MNLHRLLRERGRPIKISIWYPAQPAPEAKMLTFGDYLEMLGGEARFGLITDEQKRRAEDTFFAFSASHHQMVGKPTE